MVFVIAGVILAMIGILTFAISQMPDTPEGKKKKEKKLPPPEPPKDWQGIAERTERRLHAVEEKLHGAESQIREKDKELHERKMEFAGLESKFQQEQTWRKKEEDSVLKEKKREKGLEEELGKAQESLNKESGLRIKLEYEVRELRTTRESMSTDVRRLTAQNLDLERKFKAYSDENRELKRENGLLKEKKEADQWVAKDEYLHVDKMLKRARWEVDQFKHKFPKEMWPQSILPKMEPVKPLAAGAAAPAAEEPVVKRVIPGITDQPAPSAAAAPDAQRQPGSSAAPSTQAGPEPQAPSSTEEPKKD